MVYISIVEEIWRKVAYSCTLLFLFFDNPIALMSGIYNLPEIYEYGMRIEEIYIGSYKKK